MKYGITARCEDGTVWFGYGLWHSRLQDAETWTDQRQAEAIARDLNYKREDWLGPVSVRPVK